MSKAGQKYYAVKVGRLPGIYETWAECQKQTSGYPGAVFKSFKTEAEAKAFIDGTQAVTKLSKGLVAYVDGSYNAKTGAYGCGVVFLEDGQYLGSIQDQGQNPDYKDLRNVAGEIMGSLTAVNYAYQHGYDHITIAYDYMGIEQWATGGWKATKPLTQSYQKKMQQLMQHVSVDFVKVEAHTGNYYNEEADRLAKEAVGNL